MKRTFAVSAVLLIILSAMAFVPGVDADSDKVRVSNSYVFYAEFDYEEGMILTDSNTLFIKESNTEALDVLMRYVNGENVDIPSTDDRNSGFNEGEKFYAFRAGSSLKTDIKLTILDENSKDGSRSVTSMISGFRLPYNGGLFVKAGDSFSIKVTSAVDNFGEKVSCYIREGGSKIYLEDGYSGSTNTTTEFSFSTEKDGGPRSFYIDVYYEGTGFSTPKGSSAIFVTICAIITICVMLLMFMAGRGPKWSK